MRDEWSRFSPAEIERRRSESVASMKARDREDFDLRYQETCDRLYWTRGQCCAGCDHWASDGGLTGTCDASGIVSGADVLRSAFGTSFCSYMPPPGLPFCRAEFCCGKFKDDFDWSSLDLDYLSRIGALKCGELKPKPLAHATDATRADMEKW